MANTATERVSMTTVATQDKATTSYIRRDSRVSPLLSLNP